MTHDYEITITLKVESDRPLTPEQLESLRENAEYAMERGYNEGMVTGVENFFDEELDDYYVGVDKPVATIRRTA